MSESPVLSRPVKPPTRSALPTAAGFSLIELLVVMVIIGALTMAGLSLMGNTAANAQRTGTDQVVAAIEQARTAAITRRKPVILAIAEPQAGDVDENCRFGLFEVDALPDEGSDLEARQLQRWSTLPTGVVFLDGRIRDFDNLLEQDKVQLSWKDGQNSASVHALVFNTRGGLAWPSGSDPVAVKVGNGNYRDGKAMPIKGGGASSLRIGRVVARPWRLD
jgi:prepilin-type N-terminal cleavage/methylation domain-containing protein